MTQQPQSVGKSLCFGDILEDRIFPYPQPTLLDKAKLGERIRRLESFLREHVDAAQIDRDAQIPGSILDGIKGMGLFGMTIPSQYGGLGLGAASVCRVLDALGTVDCSLATTVAAHSTLAAYSLAQFGTVAQKQHYLPRLATGELVASFAVTETLSGSDATAIRSRAESQDGRYVLHGSKHWVTNGGLAGLHVLFAQTVVNRPVGTVDRVSAFLVESGPGVVVGAERNKVGVRGLSAPTLYLNDVSLPQDRLLGESGGGFKVLMETVNYSRLGFAAICIGATRTLLRLAVQHATSRHQFGRLLSTLGMVKDKIATIATDLYAAESVVYLTAGLLDGLHQGQRSDTSIETACAKVMASEALWNAAAESMQLLASAGFATGSPHERLLRDARLFSIFPGGTNEVLRCYIALAGLAGPGQQLSRLWDAIKFPLRGYGLVVDTLIEKVKTAAYGRAILTRHHPRLKREAVLIEDTAESLAREIDRVLRRHGPQIPEMQYVQRRIASVVMDLLAMCAVVARTSASLFDRDSRVGRPAPEAEGEIDRTERELRLCVGYCSRAATRIQQTLALFTQNDDELRKSIADDCYHGRPYPFDATQ